MKILITLLTAILLTTTVHATTMYTPNKSNEAVKKQCQYIVYGNGINNVSAGFYMSGITVGIMAMSNKEDATEFGLKSTDTDIRHKACQRALVNTEELPFKNIYIHEVVKLLNKKFK